MRWKSIACLFLSMAPIVSQGANALAEPVGDAAPEQTVSAGPIKVMLNLDRSSLNVAESLVATLTVKAASGVRVSLPPVETKLGGFSIVSAVDEPLRTIATGEGEQQLLVRRYTLEPFLPGEYKLPPFEIRWRKRASESGVARTAEVKVMVESLLPKQAGSDEKTLDPGTIREAYISPAQRGNGPIWAGIAIGFGIALVAGAGIWAWRRRRQEIDEIEQLLERVDRLRQAAEAGAPKADALHELAGALRGALADRVEPGAATVDTSELVRRLGQSATWGESEARRVGDVLGELDAARFGGAPMPVSEFGRHLEVVTGILKKLRAMPPLAGVRR
jgi:hypothetical protein